MVGHDRMCVYAPVQHVDEGGEGVVVGPHGGHAAAAVGQRHVVGRGVQVGIHVITQLDAVRVGVAAQEGEEGDR